MGVFNIAGPKAQLSVYIARASSDAFSILEKECLKFP